MFKIPSHFVIYASLNDYDLPHSFLNLKLLDHSNCDLHFALTVSVLPEI